MPGGDRTGPAGAGSGTGRGMGQGRGRGRMGGFGLGAVGNCVCPRCGKTQAHRRGVPCTQTPCPACGTAMIRER